jgi:hypothetical protein
MESSILREVAGDKLPRMARMAGWFRDVPLIFNPAMRILNLWHRFLIGIHDQ